MIFSSSRYTEVSKLKCQPVDVNSCVTKLLTVGPRGPGYSLKSKRSLKSGNQIVLLCKMTQSGFGVSSLEISKNPLDVVLDSLLWVSLLGQSRARGTQRCFNPQPFYADSLSLDLQTWLTGQGVLMCLILMEGELENISTPQTYARQIYADFIFWIFSVSNFVKPIMNNKKLHAHA